VHFDRPLCNLSTHALIGIKLWVQLICHCLGFCLFVRLDSKILQHKPIIHTLSEILQLERWNSRLIICIGSFEDHLSLAEWRWLIWIYYTLSALTATISWLVMWNSYSTSLSFCWLVEFKPLRCSEQKKKVIFIFLSALFPQLFTSCLFMVKHLSWSIDLRVFKDRGVSKTCVVSCMYGN
jgi:hypothetical protein